MAINNVCIPGHFRLYVIYRINNLCSRIIIQYMYVCVYICIFSIIMLYKYSHLAYLNPSNLVLKSQFSIVQYHVLKNGTIAWVP